MLVGVSALLGIDVVLAPFLSGGVSAFLGIADIGVGDVVLAPFNRGWVLVDVSAFLGIDAVLAPFMVPRGQWFEVHY